MPKVNILKKFTSWRIILSRFLIFVGLLTIIVCIATLSKSNSFTSFLDSDSSYHSEHFTYQQLNTRDIKENLEIVIHKIQEQLDEMRDSGEESRRDAKVKHASFLADILGIIESVLESVSVVSDESAPVSPNRHVGEASEYFLTEEIRKYIKIKPNRLGKQNFMGANGSFTSIGHACFSMKEELERLVVVCERRYIKIKPNRLGKQNFMGANGSFTSIGHACFSMKEELERYMEYDIGDICNDDWKLAQKLLVHGCDPLPRRRCLSKAPQFYTKPLPTHESLWAIPDDKNVRWSGYKCKNFSCLVSNVTKKGFFKCSDCFNLNDHELPRWIEQSNVTSDFLIPEVLDLKPNEIRIGLDFSVGTGSFAARMREHNVTIVSATINLGAPFNEMIALRGLVPLYLTINQRLPFFDNTLDLIHTTRFLDGWIDLVLLDFVVYDWDRVLRPGGLLWIDSFFCLKEDLYDYLQVFKVLSTKNISGL